MKELILRYIKVEYTNSGHTQYVEQICNLIEESAKVRGTGIAKRDPQYIKDKILENKAVIAMMADRVIGFCYIEIWEDKKYVVHSGLIVHPDFRELGLAKIIKTKLFKLSRQRFPEAKIFGITTSPAVMKINSGLGYIPVAFAQLTQEEQFWKGCQQCINYNILEEKKFKMCLCTGMLYKPPKMWFGKLKEKIKLWRV